MMHQKESEGTGKRHYRGLGKKPALLDPTTNNSYNHTKNNIAHRIDPEQNKTPCLNATIFAGYSGSFAYDDKSSKDSMLSRVTTDECIDHEGVTKSSKLSLAEQALTRGGNIPCNAGSRFINILIPSGLVQHIVRNNGVEHCQQASEDQITTRDVANDQGQHNRPQCGHGSKDFPENTFEEHQKLLDDTTDCINCHAMREEKQHDFYLQHKPNHPQLQHQQTETKKGDIKAKMKQVYRNQDEERKRQSHESNKSSKRSSPHSRMRTRNRKMNSLPNELLPNAVHHKQLIQLGSMQEQALQCLQRLEYCTKHQNERYRLLMEKQIEITNQLKRMEYNVISERVDKFAKAVKNLQDDTCPVEDFKSRTNGLTRKSENSAVTSLPKTIRKRPAKRSL